MNTVLPPEFVGLPPTTDVATPEQRLVVAERYVSELLRGYQAAGSAINRLEIHLFSLFKIVLDKDIMTWNSFVEARDELQNHEDLVDFWDVREEVELLAKVRAEAEAAAEAAKKEEEASSPEEPSTV
jgi:hypothetical protein